jgi:hypothetical protein
MLFQQLFAQPHRAGPIAVVAEELHAHSLDHHAGDRTTPQPIAETPVTPAVKNLQIVVSAGNGHLNAYSSPRPAIGVTARTTYLIAA